MKKIGLSEIFGSMCVLLGPTGGKGVVISSFKKALDVHNIDLMTLSSGDCFRRAQERDAKLKERMSAGKLIEDLDDIKLEIKANIKTYLVKLIESNKPVTDLSEGDSTRRGIYFAEDGEERLGGEYVYQEKENKVGEKAVSQVVQMSDMYWEVLAEMTDDPEYSESFASDVRVLLDGDKDEPVFIDEGVPYEYRDIYESYIGPQECRMTRGEILTFWYKSVERFLVNTTPEDSEAFMRIRSSEAITALLYNKVWQNEGHSSVGILMALDEMLLLQQGKFDITEELTTEGAKKLKLVVNHKSEGRILKPFDGVETEAFDQAMRRVAREINGMAGNNKEGNPLLNLQESLKLLVDSRTRDADKKVIVPEAELSVLDKLVGAVRVDDLQLSSRRERADIYKNETTKMLKDELGYGELSETEARVLYDLKPEAPSQGILVRKIGPGEAFVNGPGYGVSLDDIRKKATEVGNRIGNELEMQRSMIEGGRRPSHERRAA